MILFVITNGYAQITSCNCRNDLNELIQTVEKNYPGYPIKVTNSNRINYQVFTDSLRLVADTSSHCLQLLQGWLRYFRDRHLTVTFDEKKVDKAFIRSTFSGSPSFPFSIDSLHRQWQTIPEQSLEGFWKLGNLYEIAMVRQQGGYVGVITKGDSSFWMPGQIRLTLQKKSVHTWSVAISNQYHQIDTLESDFDEAYNTLIFNGIRLEKLMHTRKYNIDSFYIRKLDSNIAIIRIPSADLRYKSLIDSLIKNNFHTLTHTPNLIIDVRGNLGGFSVCYDELMPLIYTDTIVVQGIVINATNDNIKLYRTLLFKHDLPGDNKTSTKKLINQLKRHKNNYFHEPDELITIPVKYIQPEKVGILMDEGCASATEIFILNAKQSKKVTLFGRRSAGIVDYTDLIGPRRMSCPLFELWCPTSRAARLPQYPIDNIGIQPDIELSVQINWVEFVQQYLTKQDKKIATTSNSHIGY